MQGYVERMEVISMMSTYKWKFYWIALRLTYSQNSCERLESLNFIKSWHHSYYVHYFYDWLNINAIIICQQTHKMHAKVLIHGILKFLKLCAFVALSIYRNDPRTHKNYQLDNTHSGKPTHFSQGWECPSIKEIFQLNET
jgi:hypothetical protein